jgi:hypothetical protein
MNQLKEVKAGKSWQENANTILLSLSLAGIIWTLKSINDLDNKIAAQEVINNQVDAAIQNVNRVQNEQSKVLTDDGNRLGRVEQWIVDHGVKIH